MHICDDTGYRLVVLMLNICRTLIWRPSREPSSPHWCPPELVQYGWGHFTQPAQSTLKTNKIQPATLEQPEQTDQSQQEVQSSGEEREEGAEKQVTEETGESLEPDMMVTLCESPHRFLATLDDDLSLDLPSVPM